MSRAIVPDAILPIIRSDQDRIGTLEKLVRQLSSNAILPAEGAGRLLAEFGGESGNFTSANCPLTLWQNNAGTIPMALSVTPSRDCWWEVSFTGLFHTVDAAWSRLVPELALSPADADGITSQYDALEHHSGAADYEGGRVSALWKLQAGVAYTCLARVAWVSGFNWRYYRAPEYMHMHASGVFLR